MKRRFIFPVACLFFLACNKSSSDKPADNPSIFPTAAETKPAYNNTSFGVYKGVIVGSSGTIIFRVNNGDNIIKGYLSVDDKKDTLSTSETIQAGEAIHNVLFQGSISSMRVSANADGSNAALTEIQINGHQNVTGFIRHENADQQIYCYEGTFTGTASGIITATRQGMNNNNDSAFFLIKVTSVNDTSLYRGFDGVRQDSTLVYVYNYPEITPAFTIHGIFNMGDFNPNTLNGTWSGKYGEGQFTTHRTW